MYRSLFNIVFLFGLLLVAPVLQAQEEDSLFDHIIIEEPVPQGSSYDSSLFNTASAPVVELRQVPAQQLDQLKNDEAFWYVDGVKKKEAATGSVPLWQKGWFKSLMWFIIVGTFVAIIIMFLASSDISLFRSRGRRLASREEAEAIPEDIFSIDISAEIQRALSVNNYRLAIRYLYLGSLKDMAERGIIQYSPEKTDQEYLGQLSRTNYYRDFFRLSRFFQYAWYGGFPVSQETFALVQKQFNEFKPGQAA